MRRIIILCSLVICCVAAAPTSPQPSAGAKVHDLLLQRPSPINPDVPSDPKPDEKITKITDPKEIVKHKRATEDNPFDHISRFAPTALPNRQVENKLSQESSEHSLENQNNSSHHRQKRGGDENKATKKNSKVSAVPVPAPARDLPHSRQRRQVDPHLIGASTVAVAPLLHIDQDQKESTDAAQHETNSEDSQAIGIGKDSETLASESTVAALLVKRDIPVPLVPKYQHPEESPKSNETQGEDEGKQQKNSAESDSKSSESDESAESHEDTKEKKPVIQTSNLPISQHQKPNIPVQVSSTIVDNEELEVHTTPIAELADKSTALHNVTTAIEHINEPLVEQLAGIKPTQIIAYETAASKEPITIKHPKPVAELFSKQKPA